MESKKVLFINVGKIESTWKNYDLGRYYGNHMKRTRRRERYNTEIGHARSQMAHERNISIAARMRKEKGGVEV